MNHNFFTERSSRSHLQQSYTDLNSLQSIRDYGIKNKDAALEKVAQQFESIFIQMILKNVRSANNILAQDNPLNSFEMRHHQEMYDNQISLSLSNGKADEKKIGLATAFYRQMKNNYLLNQHNSIKANHEKKQNNDLTIPQRI